MGAVRPENQAGDDGGCAEFFRSGVRSVWPDIDLYGADRSSAPRGATWPAFTRQGRRCLISCEEAKARLLQQDFGALASVDRECKPAHLSVVTQFEFSGLI